jgi:hypothetical protein
MTFVVLVWIKILVQHVIKIVHYELAGITYSFFLLNSVGVNYLNLRTIVVHKSGQLIWSTPFRKTYVNKHESEAELLSLISTTTVSKLTAQGISKQR